MAIINLLKGSIEAPVGRTGGIVPSVQEAILDAKFMREEHEPINLQNGDIVHLMQIAKFTDIQSVFSELAIPDDNPGDVLIRWVEYLADGSDGALQPVASFDITGLTGPTNTYLPNQNRWLEFGGRFEAVIQAAEMIKARIKVNYHSVSFMADDGMVW